MLVLVASSAFALDPTREISQYAHTMWTLQEGFLPGAPTEITQSIDGYLWIGTRNGLVRFDGVRFTPFTPPPGQRLSSNRVLSVFGGRDGSLWIGTRSGLHRYRDGTLIDYPEAPGWIISILEDRDGRVWFTRSSIADDKGPLCEIQGERAVCHGAADGVPISNGRQLTVDAQGNLWTVSDHALMRWNKRSASTWFPPGISAAAGAVSPDVLQGVFAAADGTIWVSATQPTRGLGLLRLVNDQLQPFIAPELDGRKLSVGPVFVDRHHAVWIGTQDEGLYRLHDGKVSRFRARDGLSADTIQGIFEDREGTLWVLTTRGIDAFRDLHVVSVTSREGLSADLANAVLARRDGTVWINTWHSLDVMRDGKITSLSAKNGLPGEEVTALFEDRLGTLWVGIDNELTIFDGGTFTPMRRRDGSPLGGARGVVEDSSGDIWVITFRPSTLVRLRNRQVIEDIPRSTVPLDRSIVADPREGVWLGLKNGDLGHYRRGQLVTIPFDRAPATGAITALVSDPNGSIMGSTSMGLIGWRNGKAQTMTADANGLPCEEIHTLLIDRQGTLWLYASCGIVTIARDQLEGWWSDSSARVRFRVFDALDGAQPAYGGFFPRSSVGPDGRLWFANASVVQVIDPNRLSRNTLPPPVHIEQVVADRTLHPVQQGLRLPPNTRDLQIDYSGLSMAVPRKTQFRYRLEGHDTEWLDAGTRRQAFYTDLRPGDYRFQVTASNNDGVWNESGTSLRFTIAPTFYQTLTFALLCIAAAIGALWLLFRLRERQIEARMQVQLEERLEERERIARELHDTLLQGLFSASLQLSVADEQIDPGAPAKPLIEKILNLLQQMSDEGRNTLRGLRDRQTEPEALERAFAQIPQDLAADDHIEYRLIVEGSQRALRPLVRDEVYRIGREALANAFRHSLGSRVETVLAYERNQFRLVVRDNGCGMDPDVVRSGREGHWGLSGMRERTDKIRGELKVMSALGAGTEVNLIVPGSTAFEPRVDGASKDWFAWLRPYMNKQ